MAGPEVLEMARRLEGELPTAAGGATSSAVTPTLTAPALGNPGSSWRQMPVTSMELLAVGLVHTWSNPEGGNGNPWTLAGLENGDFLVLQPLYFRDVFSWWLQRGCVVVVASRLSGGASPSPRSKHQTLQKIHFAAKRGIFLPTLEMKDHASRVAPSSLSPLGYIWKRLALHLFDIQVNSFPSSQSRLPVLAIWKARLEINRQTLGRGSRKKTQNRFGKRLF